MREILFRGKTINRDDGVFRRTNYRNGDWVYGLITKPYDERFETLPAEMTNTDEVTHIEVDHKTFGQYTGLNDDKNGTKIFEGDILRVTVNGNTTICKVAFAENVAQFQLWQSITLPKTPTALNLGNYECEVIGNIHDNPELLKEAENE